MNDRQLVARVVEAMDGQLTRRGYAAPVDVLLDLGLLDRQRYADWAAGRGDCLERICSANLSKLALVNRTIRLHAKERGLKGTYSAYVHKGRRLRFSVSGLADIERHYSTHYVDTRWQGDER